MSKFVEWLQHQHPNFEIDEGWLHNAAMAGAMMGGLAGRSGAEDKPRAVLPIPNPVSTTKNPNMVNNPEMQGLPTKIDMPFKVSYSKSTSAELTKIIRRSMETEGERIQAEISKRNPEFFRKGGVVRVAKIVNQNGDTVANGNGQILPGMWQKIPQHDKKTRTISGVLTMKLIYGRMVNGKLIPITNDDMK